MFLLVKPFFLKLKNILNTTRISWEIFFRTCLLLFFVSSLPYLLYRGMMWVLQKANEDPALSILPPSLLLGMILGFLQIMLIIPAIFYALGGFFLSEDLELLLASPTRTIKLFIGKFCGVLVGASWMPFIFIFPILVSFFNASETSYLFFLRATVILIPFFIIPSAIAVFGATSVTFIMPAHKARYVTHILILIALSAVYIIVQGSGLNWSSAKGSKEILRVLNFFEIGQNPFFPSTWASKAIEHALIKNELPSAEVKLLYSVMFATLSVAYLSIVAFHAKAYSLAKVRGAHTRFAFRSAANLFSKLMRVIPQQARAVITKEAKILARDIGQTIQLLVLSSLAFLYLYNIRIFTVIDSMPKSMASWWQTFLFLGNLCMGAFLTTSICTRLVFPSISLEGRALWLIQTAPISYNSYLKAKMRGWLIPVGIVSCIFFSAGASAIGANLDAVIISAILSMIVCYGIVGLAVGLGAYFARFDWEHSSQLSASLGSMLFMISAIALVFFNMLPAWLLLAGEQTYTPALGLSLPQAVAVLSVCTLIFNIIIVRAVLRMGENKLAKIGN